MQNTQLITHFLKSVSAMSSLPVYLYDTKQIAGHCNKIASIPYPQKSIHFASMANSNPEFLHFVKNQGLHIFVNSLKHLQLAEEVGFAPDQIVFTASSVDYSTLDLLYGKGIRVNLDSINQLNYWLGNYPDSLPGIRCNFDSEAIQNGRAGYFIGDKSRLGIDLSDLIDLDAKDKIGGLHLYVGTDITDIEYLMKFYTTLTKWAVHFPNIQYLDLGGGFGVDSLHPFDFERFGANVSDLMHSFSAIMNREIELILEPGRIVGAEAACFLAQVVDVKERAGRQIVVLNASLSQFPRPLFYPDEAHHPVQIFSPDGNPKPVLVQRKVGIVGCSTYSRDVFAETVLAADVQPGDVVSFGNAGSYCASMFTEFLGFEKPKELFL
ncbi:MAG: hypothetical protein CVU11_01925 [Bacteroidetes bacterium HGW-Bacteroidetes-6]|jgi:diaminopimelate decarboxylase|nr:MAG: hypothetical protein CVU11_01925 [Bacteroidetes bacterium HGW-Bacteroidetes-6]